MLLFLHSDPSDEMCAKHLRKISKENTCLIASEQNDTSLALRVLWQNICQVLVSLIISERFADTLLSAQISEIVLRWLADSGLIRSLLSQFWALHTSTRCGCGAKGQFVAYMPDKLWSLLRKEEVDWDPFNSELNLIYCDREAAPNELLEANCPVFNTL